MNSLLALTAAIFVSALLMTSSVSASPAAVAESPKEVKRSLPDVPPSRHLAIADRLLKRVLDITYETLEDLGASREDLERVQQKRNYIQTCYFQAISCY